MFLLDILPMPLFLLMILQIISIDTCILALADHSKKAYTCTKFRVMHPQILLFGGTSQGRLLSQELSAQNITHYYSTKTAVSYRPAGRSVSLTGAMSAAQIAQFCKDHAVKLIADASHPFAENLHRELSDASAWCNVPLLRLEREFGDRIVHPLVHYMADFDEVADCICYTSSRVVLAATGVNTIPKLRKLWDDGNRRVIFRVLDTAASRDQALAHGLRAEDVLCMPAPLSAAHELALLRHLGADTVLSKETGADGGLAYKISACIACDIPIYIINRPSIPDNYIVVHDMAAMLNCISDILA